VAGFLVEFNTDELERAVEGIGARAGSIPLGDIAEELKIGIDDVLQAEGAIAGGTKWDPLSPNTVKRHPRRAGRPLLQATSTLANIQTRTGPNFAEASSPARYAGFHVSGTSRMVKRDFLAIDLAATLEIMGDIILQDIVRP